MMLKAVWKLRSKARVSVPFCVPSVPSPSLRVTHFEVSRVVANPSFSPGEPAVAVPCLPVGPGIFLLTPVTQASAAGQASARWGGSCQESAG